MSERKSSYFNHVKSLLGLRKKAAQVTAPTPLQGERKRTSAPARPSHRNIEESDQEREDRREFDRQLKELATQKGQVHSLVAGRVHMLNIDRVRERMGDRWPKFANRIHDIITAELKQFMGPRDLFTQVDHNTYVIVFGDGSEVEARLKIAILSEQILEKLLGDAEKKDLQSLSVQRLVVQADGTVAAEALESMEALMAMLDDAEDGGATVDTYNYDDLASGKPAVTSEEVSNLLGNVEGHLTSLENDHDKSEAPVIRIDGSRQLMRQLESLEKATPAPAQPIAPDLASTGGPEAAVAESNGGWADFAQIQDIDTRAGREIVFVYDRDPMEPEEGSNDPPALQLSSTYLPMWHAPSQKVGIYFCQTAVVGSDGARLFAPGDQRHPDNELQSVVDRLTVRQALADIQNGVSRGTPNIVAAPIHFSSLQLRSSRNQILDLCRQFSEEHRNMLTWEIIGAHVDSWSLQLPEITRQLKLFGRAVFLRLDQRDDHSRSFRRNFPYLCRAGVHAIGLDVAQLRGSEADKLKLLERVAARAHDNGLNCYGHGFDTLSLTINAVCMGYQHVSGPAVAEPVVRPEGVRTTKMEAIYERMVADKLIAGAS